MRRTSISFVVTVASAIALVVGTPLTTYATATATHIPDGCDQGGSSQGGLFYADGPPQYWSDANYSGGPSSCLMWTYNETTYSGTTSGNEVFWYLCVGGPGWNCDGWYYTWAYQPPIHATTTNAEYQMWLSGHTYSNPSFVCGVNQWNDSNVWHELADSNVSNCTVGGISPDTSFYFCGDENANPSCGGFVQLQDGTGEQNFTTQVGVVDLGYCPSAPSGGCPNSWWGGGGIVH